MDWFAFFRRLRRNVCACAKVINVIRAAAWLFDCWDDHDQQ